MKRSPEEVVEDLRESAASRFDDENLTEMLLEAANVIERLDVIRRGEIMYTEISGPFGLPPVRVGVRKKAKEISKAERHREICQQLTAIYEAKNHDYGDSFARVRGMHPEAICIRLWDKLLRLESLMHGKTAKVDESIEDTLKDLANYAIMELVERGVSEDDEQ